MNFMLITNEPEFAKYAAQCGIGRIFVDLEINGKKERQGHLDTFISSHVMSDVDKVKDVIRYTSSELLVRLNPLYENTKNEVDEAIELGADILMLPMFTCADQIKVFCELVDERVKVMPLVETADALYNLSEIVKVSGVSEVFIGLNDLHLDLGLDFMFELLSNGILENAANILTKSGMPFGFGGIARISEGLLPAEYILGEHLRLGSSSVILSRTFNQKMDDMLVAQNPLDIFKFEINKIKETIGFLKRRTDQQILDDKIAVIKKVQSIVAERKKIKVNHVIEFI